MGSVHDVAVSITSYAKVGDDSFLWARALPQSRLSKAGSIGSILTSVALGCVSQALRPGHVVRRTVWHVLCHQTLRRDTT